MEYDLTDDDDLRRACDSVKLDPAYLKEVKDFIEEGFRALKNYNLFSNENFQERLWNNNPICEAQQAPGVNTDQVIQDRDFLNWFYDHCNEIRNLEPQDRTKPLCGFADELLNKMVGYSTRSNDDRPIFCIYRALATLFPENFTRLASRNYLVCIAGQMDITVHKHNTSQVVKGHHRILDRFTKVLGPVDPNDLDKVIQRMILPWGLLDATSQEELDEERDPSSNLNTIFYGPPGTGKTYSTARRCVEICDGIVLDDWSDKKIRERYSELVKEHRIEFVTFHQSYGYEEFIEGLRPDTSRGGAGFSLSPTKGVLRRITEQARNKTEPYVLVIDEINRANVSKVMGELVTLLEEDKREGAENEVIVTLPYSGKPFTLPANLHILGTMNTADRSIALLDTALRRRFDFEEIVPDPDTLNTVESINLPNVLRAINDRLEFLIDRDHLIGHAWLMKTHTKAEIDRIMQRKIIPLIAEYFYDDWEKVRAVLGGTDDFVHGEKLNPPPGLDDMGEDRYRWTVQENFEVDAYNRLISGQAPAGEEESEES